MNAPYILPYCLPDSNAQTLGPPGELHFYHSHTVELTRSVSPIDAWNLMMATPMPLLSLAFRIRDTISSKFGVRQIGGFTSAHKQSVVAGDKLDFFLVEYASDDVLSLSERDKHLDVLICLSREERRFTITSSVQTHNAFGRAYMIPVAPAHKLIVHKLLADLQRRV